MARTVCISPDEAQKVTSLCQRRTGTARHGWRKMQPGSKHPKSDPSTQEE